MDENAMTFTDDDLKMAKATNENGNGKVSGDNLKALLTRLEAAEKVVQDKIDRGWGDHPLVQAWFASKGGKDEL